MLIKIPKPRCHVVIFTDPGRNYLLTRDEFPVRTAGVGGPELVTQGRVDRGGYRLSDHHS